MATDDCILISGAGPVGTITGLALARQGIPVKLFDTLAEIPTDHRAATLHPSTLDMVEGIGLTERLMAKGIASPHFQYRDRATGEIVAEFDYRDIGDETRHPYALQVEQHKTIGVALELAQLHSAFQLTRPCTVVEVGQTADRVEITVEHPDGRRETHRGRYLIGCEGGRSITRKTFDIDFPGFTWQERFIIVATHFDFAAAGGYRFRNYVAHPDQWCALMKVPGERFEGIWRCLFPALTDEPNEVVTSDEWIQARFQECLPFAPSFTIVHRNLYDVHQRVAASFRAGRALLAGDSAHVNNPIGGMGMNSGIHDGLNLATKLGRIWRGEADESVLDQYDRQRRPTAQKYVQAQSIRNKETLQEKDPAIRRKRLDELKRTADTKALAHDFMLRSSLIAMVREADATA
ncbi:MAG: FAD-dependent monooxygenase [Alphaproteobacteria bacterium]|nr:FAD-dependent monooxygenase [Alphaproteobacteria bacterium]